MATCPDSTDCLRAYYNPITAATCLSSSYSTPILSIPSQIGIHCHTGNALQAYPQSHLSLATQDGCPIFAPRRWGTRLGLQAKDGTGDRLGVRSRCGSGFQFGLESREWE